MITVNNQKVPFFKFPGGEIQASIKGISIGKHTYIVAWLYSSDDIITLILTVNAVRHVEPGTNIELTIPYLPYARQDRVCNPGEAFSAEVIAGIINSLNCKSVRVIDAHSPVSTSLINNCRNSTQHEIGILLGFHDFIIKHDLCLVAPDKGAEARIKLWLKYFVDVGRPVKATFFCSKKRNPQTGEILGVEVPDDVSKENLVILDDICDGGRTFVELARELKKKGAGDIYLFVTHGIFSNGFDQLTENIKHIFCAHAFPGADTNNQHLTVLGGWNAL